MTAKPAGPRKRRRRLLSEEGILDAALALIDETGELTMSALAARLGSTASSIYHHISGRPAIIEALRDRITREIPHVHEGEEWTSELGRMMRAYRDAFARHSRLIPLVTAQTLTAEGPAIAYEHIVRLLSAAGFPDRELLLWVSVIDNFVLGCAFDLAAPEDVWRREGKDTPALDAAVAASLTGAERADAAFDLGCEALLVGMRARLAAENSPQ
ncbi:MAG TPA: TetR/AcrR family transcriptional regulator C-terminal domain-containing protein [Kineosporiaceae bacterium]|nr:TetR/AcrR family transcriptional regulator C-terminal domain-containing protein [Kineosporiaceae bacterium]